MGRYAPVIDPFRRPRSRSRPAPAPPVRGPRSRSRSPSRPGTAGPRPADFTGPLAVIGRARARFGQAVATFDADGDGRLDLYLTAAVVGPEGGPRRPPAQPGRRDDSRTPPPPSACPTTGPSLGVAAGDFDADRRVDLFLTGVGDNRLYRNLGGQVRGRDQGGRDRPARPPSASTARWLDLDQDGDLDL